VPRRTTNSPAALQILAQGRASIRPTRSSAARATTPPTLLSPRSSGTAQRDESEKLEEKGKPTARDAAGEKQQGYKSDDDEEELPLAK
jgi:hypothetical protein